MAREVKINLSELDNAIDVYDKEIDNLELAYNQVNNAMKKLQSSAWKSTGADVFFDNYDHSWNKDFKDHIDYLKHLRDCLKLARDGFYEEYNKKVF